jgi:hypothetical protein
MSMVSFKESGVKFMRMIKMILGLLIVPPNTKTSTSNIVGVIHIIGVDNKPTFINTLKIIRVTFLFVNTLNGSIIGSTRMVSVM